MFKNSNPKDLAVIMLTITLCIVLIASTLGAIFFGKESPTITEIVAFLLGSVVTIIGEYILLQLKTPQPPVNHECNCDEDEDDDEDMN